MTAWILIGIATALLVFVAGVAVGHVNINWQTADQVEAWTLIDELREPEGATVTICGDNPDFGGPESVVEVCDDWTGWLPRRFEGETVLHALRAARYTRGER